MGIFSGLAGDVIGAVGSLIGGNKAQQNAEKTQRMNYQAQKEFAQNGIRWKVADAKAAGIHPLYALGASTNSFTPISGYAGDNGISQAANEFGQGISRAVQAKMTRDEREAAQARQEMQDVFTLARFRQEQRYQDAQIRLIDSEIARNKVASDVALMTAAKTAPMPGSPTLLPGQADAPPAGTKEAPYWDTSIPYVGFAHDPEGRKQAVIPSDPMAQRTEDKLVIEWIPWVASVFDNFRAKVLGKEVHGYWWHGDDKGFLPYPPKKKKDFLENISDVVRFYRDYGG